MNKREFEEECRYRVDCIVSELNSIADDGDYERMIEYLEDVLDGEYRVGMDHEYSSVCIVKGLGGPNIYIDTDDSHVRLYWGSTIVEKYFDSRASDMIDEHYKELYDCR